MLASCSVVALTAVLYGCSSSSDNSALDSANDQVAELTGQLETANSTIATLTTDLAAATGSVETLTADLAAATGSVETLTADLATATTDLAAATANVETLTADLATATTDLAAATANVETLTADLAAATADLNAANVRIAALVAGTDEGQLTPIQTDAKTASDAAATAETAAGTAADEAEAAMANRTTIQTGMANSIADAYAARAAATTAMEEAAKALAASEAATTAGNASDATAEQAKAKAAQTAAETAQTAAETARDDAVADAAAELKIDDTVKTVGDTTIDAAAASSVVITDGETVDTGLQSNDMQPKTTVDASLRVVGVAGNQEATSNPYVAPMVGAEENTFDIGKTVDAADDLARLMIVTSYAGTRTVKVYASDNALVTVRNSPKSNSVRIGDGPDNTADTADDVLARLKSLGAYYRAGDTNTLTPPDQDNGAEVAADAKATQVYSYATPAANDADPDDINYVVRHSKTTTAGGDTTYHYAAAYIHVELDRDGDGDGDNVGVTAKIPEATDYQHIHFGVWAALGDAEKDGMHEIDDLGIGFVQNYSGGGMTGADMPNNGEATYSGSWVAAVQAADDDGNGDISLTTDDATIAADFGEGDITATLTNLATLTGSIAGNQFSGTEASATGGGLDSSAKFDGTFSGGFYGAKGAEAGGVFDFASEDNEGGAFRGAFGGRKD